MFRVTCYHLPHRIGHNEGPFWFDHDFTGPANKTVFLILRYNREPTRHECAELIVFRFNDLPSIPVNATPLAVYRYGGAMGQWVKPFSMRIFRRNHHFACLINIIKESFSGLNRSPPVAELVGL